MTRHIAAVHVWQDNDVYSVSEIGYKENEIRCIGSWSDLATAWRIGHAHAQRLGVECVEYADESGVATDRWTPEMTVEGDNGREG